MKGLKWNLSQNHLKQFTFIFLFFWRFLLCLTESFFYLFFVWTDSTSSESMVKSTDSTHSLISISSRSIHSSSSSSSVLFSRAQFPLIYANVIVKRFCPTYLFIPWFSESLQLHAAPDGVSIFICYSSRYFNN